jgi:hypothetical protein
MNAPERRRVAVEELPLEHELEINPRGDRKGSAGGTSQEYRRNRPH